MKFSLHQWAKMNHVDDDCARRWMDLRPYVIRYKHNRTGKEVSTTVWAHSTEDARERFRDCDERHDAERIIGVKRDE